MIDYEDSLLDYQKLLYKEEIKKYVKILERNEISKAKLIRLKSINK